MSDVIFSTEGNGVDSETWLWPTCDYDLAVFFVYALIVWDSRDVDVDGVRDVNGPLMMLDTVGPHIEVAKLT